MATDVPFTVPSREEVLACAEPQDLFGAALEDPRSLKRAYAALAKAFRAGQDDEVFQHVRALYDAARARPAPVPETVLPPAVRLRQALETHSVGAMLGVLADHAAELALEMPDAVVEAVRFAVFGAGPRLTAEAVDVVELVVTRPDLPMHPGLHEALLGDIIALRALERAAADPAVPEVFLAALCDGWRRPAPEVGAAWLPAAEALGSAEVDALMVHLDEVHPAVLGVMQRQDLRLRGTGRRELPTARQEALRDEYTPSSVVVHALDYHPALSSWWRLLWMAIIWWLLSDISERLWPAALLSIIVGELVNVVIRFGLRNVWFGPRLERLHDGDIEALVHEARAAGLWAHEVADGLRGEIAPQVTGAAYQPGHRLLALRQDVGVTFKLLTPAHVARLEEQARASEAEASDA